MKFSFVVIIALFLSVHRSDSIVSFSEIKNNAQPIVMMGIFASIGGMCWYFWKNWNKPKNISKNGVQILQSKDNNGLPIERALDVDIPDNELKATIVSSPESTISIVDVFLLKTKCEEIDCKKHTHRSFLSEQYTLIPKKIDYQIMTADVLKSIKWDEIKYILIDNLIYDEQKGSDISVLRSYENSVDTFSISQVGDGECESLTTMKVEFINDIEKKVPQLAIKILDDGMLCIRILKEAIGAKFSFDLRLRKIPPIILQGFICAKFVSPIKQDRLIMRANELSKFESSDNGKIDVQLLYMILEGYASCGLTGKARSQIIKIDDKASCDTPYLESKSIDVYSGDFGSCAKLNLGKKPKSFTGKWYSQRHLYFTTDNQSFKHSVETRKDPSCLYGAIIYKENADELKLQSLQWG